MKQATAMTMRATTPAVVATLRACAADPMWANHAEVSKNTLTEAADLIDAMVVELCRVQREASGINAELTSVQSGDKTHAIRDSLLAGSRLSRLQDDIRGFLVARGA